MKLFIQTGLGIAALLIGVTLLYFFMSGLGKGANFIFLALSLVFIGAGAFLFIRVAKIQNAIQEGITEPIAAESGTKLLQKNNQMIKDYNQANGKKENLKAVQLAVGAEATAIAEEGK